MTVAIAAGLFSPLAASVEKERLWLPSSYRGHYLKLKKAAEMLEATGACAEVLRATIDLDESTEELPWYRILCRSETGGSFTELVDGVDFQPRTERRNTAPPETAQERLARQAEAAQQAELAKQQEQKAAVDEQRKNDEARRQAAEQDKQLAQQREQEEQRRQQVLAKICDTQILARTAMMMNIKWITQVPVAEVLDNGQMRFYAEFDAQDSWGKPLQYQAVCIISTPAEFVVTLTRRRQ